MSAVPSPSLPPPAAAPPNPFSRGGLGSGFQSVQTSTTGPPFSGLLLLFPKGRTGGGAGERTNESPNPSHWEPLGSLCSYSDPTPPPPAQNAQTQRAGVYKRSQRERRAASGEGRASMAPGKKGRPGRSSHTTKRGPSPHTTAGAAGTHQLLQVLLRELRVTVPLLLELVPGGFGHHHHPRGAEAAFRAAATARQLARLPLPQVSPAAAVTAEPRPRGGASRARPSQHRRPAACHTPTAAQQEASVASHPPPARAAGPGSRHQQCAPPAQPRPLTPRRAGRG